MKVGFEHANMIKLAQNCVIRSVETFGYC